MFLLEVLRNICAAFGQEEIPDETGTQFIPGNVFRQHDVSSGRAWHTDAILCLSPRWVGYPLLHSYTIHYTRGCYTLPHLM